MKIRAIYRPASQEVTIYEGGNALGERHRVANHQGALALARLLDPDVVLEEESNTVYGLLKSAGRFGVPPV